ncbi:PREDICTED: uncharacterized protein LOC108373284 [Rhagoletis zephyria]|uniref:uncharacterized protein LOC108373284 n=1 Tax=Rhagoletis zephyria TaxID=28612 RepID=UPI00081174B9|nr:PREDICTED: uncharacterized protein LOC108373284 [Rhagoletis zephyria]
MHMSKSSYQTLCTLIEPHLPKQKVHLTIPVAPEKQIVICLYKLASCAEYRVVGDVSGVHKSTVHKYFHIVLESILKLTKDFIKFPDLGESLQIAKIGRIDGSHIPVLPPSKGYLDYNNRKGWPSVVMQAIVDDKYIGEDFKHALISSAGVDRGITGNVCRKSPGNNTKLLIST